MKHTTPILVLILALGAVVTGVWFGVDRGPFERTPVGTEAGFWRQAVAAHAGNPANPDAESHNDTYVRILAPLAGDDAGSVQHARRVLSTVLLLLVGGLTAILAWKRTGPWPALGAALATALSASIILPAGSFSPGPVAAVLLLLAMVILDGRPTLVTWILGGLLAGVAAYLQPTLGWGFLLAAVIWLLVRPVALPRGAAAALFAAGWLLGAMGSGAALGGNLIPQVSGVEFYRGHRAAASGLHPYRADHDEVRWWTAEDFLIQVSTERKRVVTPSESDEYWRIKAFGDMARAPHRELARVGIKTWAALQAQPLPGAVGSVMLETTTDRPGIRVATWIGAVLLPLGLAGLIARRRRAGWLLGVGLLSAPAAAWITYAMPETRLVTLAVLAVGFGLFLRALMDGPGRGKLIVGGVVAVGLFGVLPRFALPGQGIVSMDHFHLGFLYDREGRGSAAMREFDRSLRLDPQNPYPRLAVASMLAKDQVLDEAIVELEKLREQHPDYIRGLEMLARSYESRGRWEEAIQVYDILQAKAPWRSDYANEIGGVYLQAGYFDRAEAWFAKALELNPDNQAARTNLDGMKQQGYALTGNTEDTAKSAAEGVVEFMRQGNLAGADSVMTLARARWTDPATGKIPAPLRFVEATLRYQQGRCADAIAAYEELNPVMSSSEVFLNNLAAAYAECNRLEDAVKTWSQALRLNPGNEVIADQLRRARKELEQRQAAEDSLR